jgi:hypothetical protein
LAHAGGAGGGGIAHKRGLDLLHVFDNCADDAGHAKGAGLHGGGGQILGEGAELGFDDIGAELHGAVGAGGVARGDGGDHGAAVDAEVVEGLEVGLEAVPG